MTNQAKFTQNEMSVDISKAKAEAKANADAKAKAVANSTKKVVTQSWPKLSNN